MAQKIIYFTAGAVPTAPELVEIATLNALAAARYTVDVRRGDAQVSQAYGAGNPDSDFVAGTPPAVAPYNTADVIVPGDEAVVRDGDELTGVTPSGSYTDTVTFTVEDGAITAIVLS